MKLYGISKERWGSLEIWGCDFVASDANEIKRADMANLMRLVKESSKEGLSIMSRVVWEYGEERYGEGRKEGCDGATRKIAATLLSMGADVSYIAKATGLEQAEIKNLPNFSTP